ncbi:hypothetical protein N4T77_08225 [Clostridium sp. CX1]|uniref:hypothetical protein n=1 Tax=Clostridium sp. CX1 TaxID=2978346 RepID=UPI0021C105B3|nr:hypothetical protein [Clostridium sp. CX1]MCT8976581.1 hypothetical protein [Clostridium sp. CX1]
MTKKLLIVLISLILFSINVSAEELTNIEIFDVRKESVVKRIKSDPELQKEAEGYLKNINGVITKFNPIPNNGYMIKIPFDTPVEVENPLLKSFVDEVIIILPKDETPYLMVFDNKDRALFFTFKGNLDILLKKLKFSPYLPLSPQKRIYSSFGNIG